MFVEVGGTRDEERIKQYLEAGVGRSYLDRLRPRIVIPRKVCREIRRKIAVGVDAKDGRVAIHGWKTVNDETAFEFCRYLKDSMRVGHLHRHRERRRPSGERTLLHIKTQRGLRTRCHRLGRHHVYFGDRGTSRRDLRGDTRQGALHGRAGPRCL